MAFALVHSGHASEGWTRWVTALLVGVLVFASTDNAWLGLLALVVAAQILRTETDASPPEPRAHALEHQ